MQCSQVVQLARVGVRVLVVDVVCVMLVLIARVVVHAVSTQFRSQFSVVGDVLFTVNVNIHDFLEALNVKDRSPEKFIDETNVKVSHEDGFVLRNMTLAAGNTMVREFRINRVINETVFHRWHRNGSCPNGQEASSFRLRGPEFPP